MKSKLLVLGKLEQEYCFLAMRNVRGFMPEDWTEIARTSSVEETQRVAGALAGVVESGSVVTLDGDLGAGKTHFTQGLGVALGIAEPITSPTFNLMVAYGDGRIPLYHFDLYRLESADQLEDLAFYEYVEGDGVSCVEWASKFPDDMPEDRLEVFISVEGECERVISARAFGSADVLLQTWVDAL